MRKIAYLLSIIVFLYQIAYAQSHDRVNVKSQAGEESRQLGLLHQRSLDIIQQQLAAIRAIPTIDMRVRGLLQAADLLWQYREQEARAILVEALDAAEAHFKKNSAGEIRKKHSGQSFKVPDQRFIVVKAIAKHDAKWAEVLAISITEKNTTGENEVSSKSAIANNKQSSPGESIALVENLSEKLLHLAVESLPDNKLYAVAMFKKSLNYPASYLTSLFLFQLAKIDQPLADGLYQEALIVNSNSQVSDGIIYLSPYPFGLNNIIAPGKVRMFYELPPSFAINAELQKHFVRALLQYTAFYIQIVSNDTTSFKPNEQLPEAARLYIALSNLEKIAAKFLPTNTTEINNYKTAVSQLLAPDHRIQAERMLPKLTPSNESPFDSLANKASQEDDANKKDALLTRAIFTLGESEDFYRLESLASKLNNQLTRRDTLDFLYFHESHRRLKKMDWYGAISLARKIVASDIRAYVFFEIAAESTGKIKDKSVFNVLDEAIFEVIGAENTGVRIKSLLGLLGLLAKQRDKPRMMQIGHEAVSAINNNNIEDLDSNLYDTVVKRQITGKLFNQFIDYQVPCNVNDVFRNLGLASFEDGISIALQINNPSIRSTAAMAVCGSVLLGKDMTVKPKEESNIIRWRLIVWALFNLRL